MEFLDLSGLAYLFQESLWIQDRDGVFPLSGKLHPYQGFYCHALIQYDPPPVWNFGKKGGGCCHWDICPSGHEGNVYFLHVQTLEGLLDVPSLKVGLAHLDIQPLLGHDVRLRFLLSPQTPSPLGEGDLSGMRDTLTRIRDSLRWR